MMEEVLEAVGVEQRAAGEIVPPGASADAVAQAARSVRTKLQAVLPNSYGQFLCLRDGVDYNGIVFYGTTAGSGREIVAANRQWRAGGGDPGLLILGDSDMDIYAVPAGGGTAAKYDRVSGDKIEDYPDVATMIETELRRRL